jgi:hypothetical protein
MGDLLPKNQDKKDCFFNFKTKLQMLETVKGIG